MDVKLPNGRVIKGVPDDYTQDDVRALALDNRLATAQDFGIDSESVARIPTEGYPEAPKAGKGKSVEPISTLDAFLQGAAAVPIVSGLARGAQLLTRGSKIAPYTTRIAETIIPKTGTQLIGEGLVGGASGVAAQKAAESAPVGYEEVYGGAAGAATSFGLTAVPRMVSTVQEIRGMVNPVKDVANQIADLAGKGRASNQAVVALQANPNLAADIGRAQEISDLTGVSLPMLAASNGDTTISSFLSKQLAQGNNAKFTASVKQQYEAAEQQLSKAKGGIAPSMIEVDQYVRKQAEKVIAENAKLTAEAAAKSARRQTGIGNIDTRIAELSDQLRVEPGRADIGTRLSNLVEAKAASIRAELSPQYDKLITGASEAGIKLPSQSAQGLREYATDTVNADVFSAHPSLYSQIRRVFSKEGDYALSDIDSLKRATNRAIRESSDPDKTRKLIELKRQVDNAVDTIDPAFSVPYRELDAQYAQRLGIPFSQAGVTKIDRAKFVEDTVPVLTSRSTSLKQALSIIGDNPEGRKVIEDAFLYDLSTKRSIIDADGNVNPAQLQRYLRDKKEQLDLVPEVRQKIEGIGGRVSELMENRANILLAEKNSKLELAENLYTQAYGQSGGLRSVVRRALGNQQELDNLVKIADKDRVAKDGIKSAMLDDILSIQGDRLEVFRSNRAAFDKFFGKDQCAQIEALIEASQRLRDYPFQSRINIGTISKSKAEEVLGTKASTTLGELRNQVISAPRVFINHLSRFFQNTADKKEAAEIQKFLLDPKALAEAAALVNEVEVRGITEKAVNMMGKLARSSVGSLMFGGAIGAGIGVQVENPVVEPNEELLRGFGGSNQ